MSDSIPGPSPRPSPDVIREFNDRGTLWLLEDPAQLHDFLSIVAPSLAARLDFARAQRVNRSLIPADLRKRESDLIFRIPFRGGRKQSRREAWVYLLLEHQSRRDAWMPLRFLGYMVQLWELQRREAEDAGTAARRRPLNPVIPVLFYTGRRDWKTSLRLSDLMEAPPELVQFIPDWEMLFLNLHRTPAATLTQVATAVGWALRVLQVEQAPREDLERALREALDGLEGLSEEQSSQWLRVAWFLVLLLFHRREPEEYTELGEFIREQADHSKFRMKEEILAMGESMAQLIERRSRAEATRELLLRVLRARFGELPSSLVQRVQAATPEWCGELADRAARAESLAELGI